MDADFSHHVSDQHPSLSLHPYLTFPNSPLSLPLPFYDPNFPLKLIQSAKIHPSHDRPSTQTQL